MIKSYAITCLGCGCIFTRDHSPDFTYCYWCEYDDGSDDYGINDVPSDEEEELYYIWGIRI